MKTLAVRQPWATYIAEGHKRIEVRSWQTHYRGPLLIAASGKPLQQVNDLGEAEILPSQRLVCVVDLVDCRPWLRNEAEAACLDDDDWDTGFWGWHITNPRHVRPIAHKGRLMLYETPVAQIEYLPPDMHYLDA